MSLAAYWPTREERSFFEREGYLVVEDALTPAQVTALTEAVDRAGRDEVGYFNKVDILRLEPAFLTLLDIPPVFAKICGFLGWNIRVNHTHFNVRPPDDPEKTYPYRWHCDGGNTLADLQGAPAMTAIKVGFYLTDQSRADMGQTYLIPRAHTQEAYDRLGPESPPPPEAIRLSLKPGAAIMFQQRTWHSQGSPNYSALTRKSIFVQWAFRWLAPVDTWTLGDLEERVTDPIKRQMLGLAEPRPPGLLSAAYYPRENDIPLKRKLLKEVGVGRLSEIGPVTARSMGRYLNFSLD